MSTGGTVEPVEPRDTVESLYEQIAMLRHHRSLQPEPEDTVASLRRKIEILKKDYEKRLSTVFERAQLYSKRVERFAKIDMVDKYVLALLPALVAKHTSQYDLAQDAFDTAEILIEQRDAYLGGA
jgi:hypothetical protein